MREASAWAAKIWFTRAVSAAGVLTFTKSSTSTFGLTVWISSWWATNQASLLALLNWFGHTEAESPFAGTQAPACRTNPAAHVAQALPAQPRLQSHARVLRLQAPCAPHAVGQSARKCRLSKRYVPVASQGTLTTTLILKS